MPIYINKVSLRIYKCTSFYEYYFQKLLCSLKKKKKINNLCKFKQHKVFLIIAPTTMYLVM